MPQAKPKAPDLVGVNSRVVVANGAMPLPFCFHLETSIHRLNRNFPDQIACTHKVTPEVYGLI